MIKLATASDLTMVQNIMEDIRREEPSYWPYGLSTEQFNGGLYLVKESASAHPVGFVGWQKMQEKGKNVGYYAIGILPPYRERGFAKSAVAQVIREARQHCDDVKALIMQHNEPSKALARSLHIDIIEKAANSKQEALLGALGALGSSVFFDQAADPERSIGSTFQPWQWDKERALMGGLNAILGAGGGAAIAKGNTLTGAGILALAPTKDLAMKGIGSLYHVDEAAQEAAKTFAHERSRPDPVTPSNLIQSVPKEAWIGAGGLGLGVLGLLLYNAKKKRDLEERRLAQEAAGVARVTLPTDQPGDLETQIQLPVGDLHLSNAILQNLGRDTRRRLRAETRQRTVRRGERKEEPKQEKAAAIIGLLEELNKQAMGNPAPASNVPTPPQTGQNPALRMQQQQQATAQSITPPPAANPAVMQAEQKAMQVEQAAVQQQTQAEQASQQAQMEMQQNFQQELAKNEQEKEVLKLQLEKEKAMSDLTKATVKAQTELSKAQSDGAASASAGENSVAGRLISKRLDRMQNRIGSIKAAAAGTLEVGGNTYATGIPKTPTVVPPAAALPPPTARQMDVAGNRYITGAAGMPGSIDAATGGKVPEPARHIKPEALQRINNNAGSNALFPSVGLYRASYGGLLDTAFDWTLKKMLTTPKPRQTRFVGQSDITNSPDRMGMISQLYSNAITTNPLLSNA